MGWTTLPLKRVLLDSIHTCNSLRYFKNIHAPLVTTGIVGEELIVNGAIGFYENSVDFVDYACDFLKRRILRDGFWPDMYAFPAVLKSCAKFTGIGERRQVHGVVVKMGFTCDLYVQNSLVCFYSVCRECMGAGRVFDDMIVRDEVSWSGIISRYVRAGLFNEAVALYLRMDVEPNIPISKILRQGKVLIQGPPDVQSLEGKEEYTTVKKATKKVITDLFSNQTTQGRRHVMRSECASAVLGSQKMVGAEPVLVLNGEDASQFPVLRGISKA